MAWKPIRVEPLPESRYELYRYYGTSRYWIAGLTAESGLCIQDVVKKAAAGYDFGTFRRATLYLIGGIWSRIADLDYEEKRIVPPVSEQMRIDELAQKTS